MSRALAQLVNAPHQFVRIEAEGAGVDAEGQRRAPSRRIAGGRAHEVAEQRQRHVVDRDIAQVVQRVQRGHAAGAGQAGDHDERTRVSRWRRSEIERWAVGHGLDSRADHATAICARARRNFAEAEASNGASREHRQIDAQQSFLRRFGQALDAVRRHQIDQQRHRRPRQQLARRELHDADAAHLDQTGERGRRGRDQGPRPCGRARSGRRPPGGRLPRSGATPGRTCRRPRVRAAVRRASSGRAARSAHAGRMHQHRHCGHLRRGAARGW